MDLDALMTALQATQQKKSSVRLSDRNVVELVTKLKQLGFLGDELLYTMNGKEYITTDRLRTDIERALQQAGGRLELVELPALVGVDLVHCEKQAAAIVSGSKGTVLEAQGELLTTTYFDSLAAEINDLLQDSGVVNLTELAISYQLNTELLLSILSARLGTQLKAKMEGGVLYTPAYVRNIKAQLRGGLRAAAAPVALPALMKELGVTGAGSGAGGSMAAQLVEELVSEGVVKGAFKSGASSWVPDVFTSAQQGSVKAFYQQNGWVEYATLRKAGCPSDKAYCKTAFPDATLLECVVVGPGVVAQLEAAVEEALAAGSWTDAANALPSSFSEVDVAALLSTCSAVAAAGGGSGGSSGGSGKDKKGAAAAAAAAKHPAAQVLAGTCVVSQSLLDALQEVVVAAARQTADAAIAERRKSGAAASSSSGSAGGPPIKKQVSFTDNTTGGDDSDDDWNMGGNKKGKKGKGGGGKGGSKGGPAKGNSKGGGGKGGGSSSKDKGGGDAAPGLQQEMLEEMVLNQHPDMEGAGVDGELPAAVAALLHAPAMSAYQSALAAAFTAGAESRRRAKELSAKALEEGALRLQLYQKGAELLQEDADAQPVVVRHMLRTAGQQALDCLLAWCCQEFCPDSEPAAAAQQITAGLTTSSSSSGGSGLEVQWFAAPAARLQVVGALPKELATPVGLAMEALNGTDMQEFYNQLDAAAGECGMRLKRLDKKGEKAALAAQKARLLGLLAAEETPAAALALVVPLLVLVHCQKLVTLPGRALSAVLEKLKEQLSEEQSKLLSDYHAAVVAALRAQAAGSEEAAAEAQKQQEFLSSNLEALKGLVTQPSS